MKLKNLIVVCGALCLVAFTGCNKEDDDSDSFTFNDTTRTVLMYLFQDTNLSDELTQNINELEVGWNPEMNGTMLVYVDPSTRMTQFDGKPVLLEITHDTTDLIVSKIVKVYDDADATDPRIFRQVQDDAIAMFPADNYGLIISGHGNGFFVTNPNNKSKGLSGSDRWSYNSLDIDEIAENAPVHYDFMIFDACLMGETTTLYQLRNVTDFVVASVEVSPGDGFAYQLALDALFTLPKADLYTFTKATANYYQNDDQGKMALGTDSYTTLGVYRMAAMEQLAQVTKKVVKKLNMNYNELRDTVTGIINDPEVRVQGSMFYPNNPKYSKFPMYYDMGLLKQLLVQKKEVGLAKELNNAITNVVIQKHFALSDGFERNSPEYTELTANMSFFIPRTFDSTLRDQDEAFYSRFDWSSASGFTRERER